MKIVMIGGGYVGLVTGACFSEFGFDVICVDNDQAKIDMLNDGGVPIYEPGLENLVSKNVKAGRLRFTRDLGMAVQGVDAIFIAVGTPTRRGDGHADLVYVNAVIDELCSVLQHETTIVTKSTVPVGTGKYIKDKFAEQRPDLKVHIASNPEFLREGSAIEDFMRPNRVVVGVDSMEAEQVLSRLYRPLNLNQTPLVVTGIETAELIKYAANGFLATKISFINEIANLCEVCGADVQEVARGMGLDQRIGSKFLHVGPGYGGSCFPKDTRALAQTAMSFGVDLKLIDAVIAVNDERKLSMGPRIESILKGVHGKKIAILGLAFKPNTDDMRESPSLDIISYLKDRGAILSLYDPESMVEAQKLLPQSDMIWAENPYSALTEAEAVVIITEWNEFRALDLDRVRALLKSPCIIDLRNIYKLNEMRDAGFDYFSLGRENILST